MALNPFLNPSFDIPWSTLTVDQIEPAIDEALERAQTAVDEIARASIENVTYASTFLRLEQATEELTQAWGKVTHLQSVSDSPELRAAHNAMLPRVSAFFARIPLNADLWQRLKAAAAMPESLALTGIHRRFLDETVADFRQAGAELPEPDRKRLEALQTEL